MVFLVRRENHANITEHARNRRVVGQAFLPRPIGTPQPGGQTHFPFNIFHFSFFIESQNWKTWAPFQSRIQLEATPLAGNLGLSNRER